MEFLSVRSFSGDFLGSCTSYIVRVSLIWSVMSTYTSLFSQWISSFCDKKWRRTIKSFHPRLMLYSVHIVILELIYTSLASRSSRGECGCLLVRGETVVPCACSTIVRMHVKSRLTNARKAGPTRRLWRLCAPARLQPLSGEYMRDLYRI